MEKGDKVSVIDQDLEGIVDSITPDGKVTIVDETGMDWEFSANELIVTMAADPKKQEEPEPIEIEEKPKPVAVIEKPRILKLPELSLAFSTEDHRNWELRLCNRSGYHILCSVSQRSEQGWNNIFSGKLLNGHHSDLAHFRKGDLNDIGSFLVEAVFFKIAEYQQKEPISTEVKIRPKKFISQENFGKYAGLDGDTLVIEVANPPLKTTPSVTIARPRRSTEKPQSWKLDQRLNSHREIDLHIEHLTPDFKNLTPLEMLEIQRSTCISEIDSALQDPNTLSVTIVHGHGKGTLKKEVIRILREYGLSFNQDLYLRTGQAAIEVSLK